MRRRGFFARLSVSGMRKNGRLYVPYVFSFILSVAMYFIVCYLASGVLKGRMGGGYTMTTIMEFGRLVMMLFIAVFLFYTHSFLVRRRLSEYGLYSVLGMSRRGLSRLALWENGIVYGIGLAFGLVLGLVLTRASELFLARMTRSETPPILWPDGRVFLETALFFALVSLLLCADTIRRLVFKGARELMRQKESGEKPPKANWVIALLGFLCLGAGYGLSLQARNVLSALQSFAVAVLFVIVGTFLLFYAGSVMLCRLLKEWKSFYYRTANFISVSTMSFRMQRNAMGLASICILSTMVLVMLSSTLSMNIGIDDVIRTRYPRDIVITTEFDPAVGFDREMEEKLRTLVADHLSEEGVSAANIAQTEELALTGIWHGDGTFSLNPDDSSLSEGAFVIYVRVGEGEKRPEAGCAFAFTLEADFVTRTLTFGDMTVSLQEIPREKVTGNIASLSIVPTLHLYVREEDMPRLIQAARQVIPEEGVIPTWNYMFDLPYEEEVRRTVSQPLREMAWEMLRESYSQGRYGLAVYRGNEEREDFYALYGGLLYLGIILSLIFMSAVVLVMYYRQVTEGYEDRERYAVMRRLGMRREMIRSTVNRQLRLVFFAPIVLAGLHLAFAFPLIALLLSSFGISNRPLLALISLLAFVVFTLLYALIYRVTGNAYFRIVGRDSEDTQRF